MNNVHCVMDNKNALRVGLSCCGSQELSEKVFADYANAGIKTMELSFSWDRYDSIPWKEAYIRAQNSGVELWSFHLPFMPFADMDLTSDNKEIRNQVFTRHSELLKKAADIGIKVMVIHPSIEPYEESERHEKMQRSKEYLSDLAELADKNGAVVAVENLPRTCLGRNSSDMLELLSADDRLRSCFDTNHLLSQPIKEYILDMKDKIITTHVSDFDFKNERHWLPGEGKIDWPELIGALKEINYTGPLVYELELIPPPTINRRVLTYEDFRNNHKCLLKGDFPEAIGSPINEKCTFWKE